MSKKHFISIGSETTREVVEAQICIPSSLPVSAFSNFGDAVWNWNDPDNFRLKCYLPSALRIDWWKYSSEFGLSENIISDLKKFAFLRFTYTEIVYPGTRKISHPATLVREVRSIALFLSHLCKEMTVKNISLITWLTDIEVEDLRNSLTSYHLTRDRTLKYVLKNLASETFSKYLDGRTIRWNKFDIETLPWNKDKKREFERMPEELFSFLSNSATADVKQFLTALEISVQDKTSIGEGNNLFLQKFDEFKDSFAEYLHYREGIRIGKYKYWDAYRRKKGRIQDFNRIVNRARQAAQIIIMLYTGARSSELGSFKIDCLRKRDGEWFLIGTVIKQVSIHASIDQDEWIAIPIVCDAVEVLQQTAKITESENLFQTDHFSPRNRNFIRNQAINKTIRYYLKTIDIQKKWTCFHLRPHQFRNNLVFEMRKAELGLPFITHQLKHVSNSLKKYSTSETTLLYGNLGSAAVHNAITDANLIALREIYHPESPIAGGGAEDHKRRRKAYFEGMAIQGIEIEEVLRRLALEGLMPLTDVGLGYCQGQAKIIVNGVKTDPPCIGVLRCNPVRCGNAVIPKHKIPAWKDIIRENRARANNVEFSYALPYLNEAIKEAETVINMFQVKEPEKNV